MGLGAFCSGQSGVVSGSPMMNAPSQSELGNGGESSGDGCARETGAAGVWTAAWGAAAPFWALALAAVAERTALSAEVRIGPVAPTFGVNAAASSAPAANPSRGYTFPKTAYFHSVHKL
jgi:hypothetical protein